MKKVVYIAIIALCIFLLLLVLFFIIRSNNSIPIVSNLSWNSTPKQVSHIFGQSYNKVKNSGDTGKNIYYYKADILGEEATIECLFLYDIFLTDVYITWNNCSPGEDRGRFSVLTAKDTEPSPVFHPLSFRISKP